MNYMGCYWLDDYESLCTAGRSKGATWWFIGIIEICEIFGKAEHLSGIQFDRTALNTTADGLKLGPFSL